MDPELVRHTPRRINENSTHGMPQSRLAFSLPAFAQDPAALPPRIKRRRAAPMLPPEVFQAAEKAPEEALDTTTLSVGAGGALSLGNANSMLYTVAGDFALRRGQTSSKRKQRSTGEGGLVHATPRPASCRRGQLPLVTTKVWYDTIASSQVVSGFLPISLLRPYGSRPDAVGQSTPASQSVIDDANQQWSFDVRLRLHV